MKRKVIQIADSTQLISLPRKWCKEHGIKKGDELDVLEEKDKLNIQIQSSEKKPERVVVDVSGFGNLARTCVSALYKGGYDEFKIYFKTADELRYLQRIIKDNCLGFEIVEQGKKFVIARKISEPIPEEFESVLRRTFTFLQNMSKEAFEAVKSGDINGLSTVITTDTNINKFTYFCRRVLNKHGYGSLRKTAPIYYIVEEIEEIADKYKCICKERLNQKTGLSKGLIKLFEQVNAMLETAISLFYKFDWQKLDQLKKIKEKIDHSLPQLIQKISKKELLVLLNLLVIADKVYEFDGPIVLSRYEPILESA